MKVGYFPKENADLSDPGNLHDMSAEQGSKNSNTRQIFEAFGYGSHAITVLNHDIFLFLLKIS